MNGAILRHYVLKEFVSPAVPQIKNSRSSEIAASVGQPFVPMDITKTILGRLSWTHHRTICSWLLFVTQHEPYRATYSIAPLEREVTNNMSDRVARIK